MKTTAYIVYNSTTLKIVSTFKWFGKDISTLLKIDKSLKWINTTHPKNNDLLAEINRINGTNY